MFGRLWGRLQSWRGAKQAHELAWAPARAVVGNGLTRFQSACLTELEAVFAHHAVQVPKWMHHGVTERYFHAEVVELALEVWVYTDGADIMADGEHKVFEDWDAATPDELKGQIVRYLGAVIARRTQTV